MGQVRRRSGSLAAMLFLLLFGHAVGAESPDRPPSASEPPSVDSPSSSTTASIVQEPYVSIDAVVINPYRTVDVGSLVGGVIERFYYDEGDFIEKGQVVVHVDPKRYRLIALRAEDRLRAAEVAFALAEQEAKLKRELLQLDAATQQDMAKKGARAEIARYAMAEAKRDVDLARYDLANCKIKAPFSGYLAVRYKRPDETVERLEKVFALVDTSQVYAVADVPEILISEFLKGTEAEFVLRPDVRFTGVVDKVGKLIDPNSRTKKVYLLIDNADSQLEVGMTGALKLMK